jgi:hypothetical protein
MRHLYWRQDEAGNRAGFGLLPVRHKERQSPRLFYGTGFCDRERESGRGEPSSVELKASSKSRSRLKRPTRLSGARLFFNARPIDLNPLLDFLLVPLYRLSLRLLRAPPQRMKQAAYVIHMVSDTEARLNQFSNPGACPKICLKTSRHCSSKKSFFQLFFSLLMQFWRTAGGRLCLNGLEALTPESGFPSSDTPAINAELSSDFNRLESILKEIHRLQSAAFQCLWASGRSHVTLCRFSEIRTDESIS